MSCDWNICRYTFRCICIIVTFVVIGSWLHRYTLDKDMTVIETASYFDTQNDMFPMLSICFQQYFNDIVFEEMGFRFTGEEYEKYLRGEEYFGDEMSKLDYHSISTNLSQYVITYNVRYQNGTLHWDMPLHISWKQPYHTITLNGGRHLVKCFGLEITDGEVFHLAILMKRDIFPDRIRPSNRGFEVIFHYPNQALNAIHTLLNQWKKRDKITNYCIEFNVRGFEVDIHRYKSRLHNCVRDWKNYDYLMLEEDIRSVGCKAAYHPKSLRWPICNTKEKMSAVQTTLLKRAHPCREIETINYQMVENGVGNKPIKMQGKSWKHYFAVVLRFLSPRFKKTIAKKEIDFHSLIGYVGGYVGMIMGFAIAQIPEVISSTIIYTKQLREKFYGKSTTKFSPHTKMNMVSGEADHETSKLDDMENIKMSFEKQGQPNIVRKGIIVPRRDSKEIFEMEISDIKRKVNSLEKKLYANRFFEM